MVVESMVSSLFLNLKGREAQGIVNPGAEYDALKKESKTMLRLELLLNPREQRVKHSFEQRRRPMAVRIGQGRLPRRIDPQVVLLPLERVEAVTDLTQRLRPGQLAVLHRHKVIPGAETASMPLRFVTAHQLVELTPWKQTENLLEKAAK
jgi:hypothetical protein